MKTDKNFKITFSKFFKTPKYLSEKIRSLILSFCTYAQWLVVRAAVADKAAWRPRRPVAGASPSKWWRAERSTPNRISWSVVSGTFSYKRGIFFSFVYGFRI